MLERNHRNIASQFDPIHNFGFKNLIVSGCSFTYNNHNTASVTWPYYLRDLGGFEFVIDCSMFGAGNNHICDSLIWTLESNTVDPKESLVVVMWSGNDRDDYICPGSNIVFKSWMFEYSDTVMSGITGGSHAEAKGNTITGLKDFAQTKNLESRAIENFLCILKLYSYLKSHNYAFVFLDYRDRALPARDVDFDIRKYLPKSVANRLQNMITKVEDIYTYALKRNLLWEDDFHPSPDGHLAWTKQILIPELVKLNIH
jgi:hypothetical protein